MLIPTLRAQSVRNSQARAQLACTADATGGRGFGSGGATGSDRSFSRRVLGVLALMALLAFSRSASATPLNLALKPEPDIFSAFLDVAYTSASGAFVANGYAVNLTSGGATIPISGGSFFLEATIDAAGILSGGSLTIAGTLAGYASPLITGDIALFGFDDTPGNEPDPFEFLIDTTGGDLAGLFGPTFGVILTLNSPLLTDPAGGTNPAGGTVFGNDFASTSYAGVADIAPIPEPSSSVLALVGGFVVMQQLRRRTTAP